MNIKHSFISFGVGAFVGLSAFSISCSSSNGADTGKQQLCLQLPHDAQITLKKMAVEVDTIFEVADDGLFEVVLADGVELYFDEKGEWRRVQLRKTEPAQCVMDFLPFKAQQYIAENANGKKVKKMKRNRRGFYTVQLSNKEFLHFSKTGKFLPNDAKQLPSETRSVLAKYFAGDSIVSATVDVDREYSVELQSGISMEFDKYGVFDRIDAVKGVGVPAAYLATFPKSMVKYMDQNYPDKSIRRIIRKNYGYYLKTDKPDAVELCFNKSGNFLRNAGKEDDEN